MEVDPQLMIQTVRDAIQIAKKTTVLIRQAWDQRHQLLLLKFDPKPSTKRQVSGVAQQFIAQITDDLAEFVAVNKGINGKAVIAPEVTEDELI